MTGYWAELDHTADVAMSVSGSDLAALFTVAAQALMSLAYEPESLQQCHQLTVKLSAPDLETLLIDWLNELLYLSEKHNAYFIRFDFLILLPNELTARVESSRIRETKRPIKAATFHHIAIGKNPEGYHTEIVFDM